MTEKKKFGLQSQAYVAPRAESVETTNEGLLCASNIPPQLEGGLQGFTERPNQGGWED